jgi:leukotriene-A4 hydrolase
LGQPCEFYLAGEKGSVAAKAALGSIDWQVWFHGEGMPPVLPTPVLDKLKEAQELGALWSNGGWAEAGAAALDIGAYHSEQVVVLLDTILIAKPDEGLEHAALEKMEALYDLTSRKNSEIRFRWQMLGVTSKWHAVYPHTVAFLAEQGRMKFVRPLYRALFRGDGAAKELALQTFVRLKPTYHNITAKMVGRDLELSS